MKLIQLIGLGAVTALAACAQPAPPPAPIQGEVIYNKFGEPEGCVDGVYIPGAPVQEQCLPPGDGCEDEFYAASNRVECDYREPDEPDNGGGNRSEIQPDV